MKLVILESPYAGDVATHVAYARRALRDSLMRGEAPLASHLLYTQEGVLTDADPKERELGISAGHAWLSRADYVVIYVDYGISQGMYAGIKEAEMLGKPMSYRNIGRNPSGQ